MREIAKTTIAIIIGLAFVVLVAWWLQSISLQEEVGLGSVACRDAVRDDIHLPSPLGDLPTIKEIQERIGVNPDGILGPETQRLWDIAINNQYAREYFE